MALLTNDRVLSAELKLARDAHRLVAPIFEELDTPFHHKCKLAYAATYVNPIPGRAEGISGCAASVTAAAATGGFSDPYRWPPSTPAHRLIDRRLIRHRLRPSTAHLIKDGALVVRKRNHHAF